MTDRKMRAHDAAQYLQLSLSTLAKMRCRGDGPPYTKCGNRIILYDKDVLDGWLRERTRRPTSDVSSGSTRC
jgi:hypothetical protein